jgi:ribosomal-protein-alanine N-acetyltransferase
VSAYRFCRTDDIGLLVEALNRCWGPHFPDEPPVTAASFKRSIRDLQVWCSSCMVAFAGADPIGVLIGAKRASSTLIHRLAVHPDHMRQGHGQHLLASLSSKLAILGPPRLVAEIPESFTAARALFAASGFTEETVLTDYVRDGAAAVSASASSDAALVIPVTVDDLGANRLLPPNGTTPWERSVETLTARKDEIDGLAAATDEGIEAYILYIKEAGEVLYLRSFVEDDGLRAQLLLAHLTTRGVGALRFAKVHPAELPGDELGRLGFCGGDRYVVMSGRARSA